MEVVDDPESIAMLVVSSDPRSSISALMQAQVSRNPGERAYSAEVSIPHQKLRHLFGDAVRCECYVSSSLHTRLILSTTF